MKILHKGTKVKIDSICSNTKEDYGINDNMRTYFLGKIAIVYTDTNPKSNLVKLHLENKSSVWSFHRNDVKEIPLLNFEDEVKKPEVKTVVFNPEYL
jgi:hypothetical protein